jgi:hypothetical protein
MSKRKRDAKRKARKEAKAERKRELAPQKRRARRKRRRETMIIFVNGKQKRVPRYSEPMVEGLPVNAFISKNADAIGYLQDEDYPALFV